MPKPSPNPEPDPMAGVVDRLLAQLPGLHGEPAPAGLRPRAPVARWSTPGVTAQTGTASPSQIGVWGRVLLGLALGVMMAGWPYLKTCGAPLAGYLSAVVTVALSGLWAATASWRHRASLAHIVSLLILLYGILLAGAEVLPRIGYAVDRATWQCPDVLDRSGG